MNKEVPNWLPLDAIFAASGESSSPAMMDGASFTMDSKNVTR
jgi:hypothetical protein